MKKRNIIHSFIGLIFFSFALTSCDTFLDAPSNSLLSDDMIFSVPDSANKGIVAIYDIIGQNNSYRNRLWLQMGVNTDIEYRSGWSSTLNDTLAVTKSDDFFALYDANTTVPDGYSNNAADNPWNRLYQGIERSNLAIAGIRKYGSPAAGNDMGHLLGEALTMRAFFYYDLIKWWGDVPAWFKPVDQFSIYLPKSNRDTIYNQIIKDLQEASTIMYGPGTKYTNTTKRLSKDAARGLLARICLSAAGYSMRPIDGTDDSEIKITVTPERQKELYGIARQACRDIITDGNYSLASSFKSVFYDQCQDVETHGRETIWQLPYYMGVRGRMLYNLGLPRDADGYNNKVAIGGQFKIIPSFYYDYDANDTRRDITVVPYKVTKNATSGVMEQSLSSGVVGFNIGKWRAEWLKVPDAGTDDGVSPIVIRYADVLLMFAEADLFLNGSEGQQYFDQVRQRALGANFTQIPLTLDNIKKERAFEFCGENIRKYDLERWGELKSGIDKAKANLTALRNGTGDYANVPAIIYYKLVTDATANAANHLTNTEGVLKIYGLNRGETDDKIATDPTGGWTKKTWTNAVTTSPADYYISDNFVKTLYLQNPDKRQLLPIMYSIISTSNNLLKNDYGYDKSLIAQ